MTGNSYRYEYDRGRRVEVLATWYLRFHGYLTTPHFVLHKPDGTQYTDADILGVRFPHSAEDVVSGGPDPALDVRDDLIDVVIAECSADQAKFNKPWKEEFTATFNMSFATSASSRARIFRRSAARYATRRTASTNGSIRLAFGVA